MKQWSPRLRKAAPWLVLLVLLAGLAAVRGLAACYNIQYEITNGDFQNYNPVRHLLAGQVPYRDFTVYLGAGELYSVGALLLVLACLPPASAPGSTSRCWCWQSAWWSWAAPAAPVR